MFYLYEHYMSISHIALIVNMVQEDTAWGRLCVDGQALSVLVDASSLATGVSLVYDGAVVEAACWLRPEKDSTWTMYDKILSGTCDRYYQSTEHNGRRNSTPCKRCATHSGTRLADGLF